jgi:hypothetical protein
MTTMYMLLISTKSNTHQDMSVVQVWVLLVMKDAVEVSYGSWDSRDNILKKWVLEA